MSQIYNGVNAYLKLLLWVCCFLYFINASIGGILVPDYNEMGRKLPPGVPREVDTNGVVKYVDHHFTTAAYQDAALQMIIHEANSVARELGLNDKLPITLTNIAEFHISPFGFAYAYKMIGNVTTKNYVYYVSCGNKLSQVDSVNYDQFCQHCVDYNLLPIKEFDTNCAFSTATNWLSKIAIDVAKLNQECEAHVALSAYWNHFTHLGDLPKTNFVPIYYVWWTYPNTNDMSSTAAVEVELFEPSKKLLQLTIEDAKYNLRSPIVFTNMAALFPGTAYIHTNYPTTVVTITNLLWNN